MNFGPTWVGEVELSETLPPVHLPEARQYGQARLLVRVHRHPLGFIQLPTTGRRLEPDAIAQAVRASLGQELDAHLRQDGLDAASWLPGAGLPLARCAADLPPGDTLISVVICTRDRPKSLAAALSNLRRLVYENMEIVVVDSASVTPETAQVVRTFSKADGRFRYVREAAPGLSRARNCGVREARGEIVAFTDDDVLVDDRWLHGLAAGFARDARVACVTGIVPSAELDNLAQLYFDQRVTWGSSCRPRLYDLRDHRYDSPLYPYTAGIFGTGANFALVRQRLLEMGGFDERLGAGTRTHGGEDLDIFVRTLQAGHMLAYEPSAIAWHFHRAEMDDLRRQMFHYGLGLAAFVTKHLFSSRTAAPILRRLPRGVLHAFSMWGKGSGAASLQHSMALSEALGMAAGPWAYLRGAWDSRQPRVEVT